MPTLVLDTIQDAQIETLGLTKRCVRSGYLLDVPVGVDPDPEVMHTALGMVQAQSGVSYPNHPELLLTRVFLKPFTSNGFLVRVTYETLSGLTPSVYIIRDRAWVTGQQTNIVPGLAIPIRCKWTGQAGGSGEPTPMVPADNVTMTFNLPMFGFDVTGLVYGTPTGQKQLQVGKVNDATWPTTGERVAASRPKGWWQLVAYTEEHSVYSGYFTYSGSAISRSWGDWSEYGILRSHLTGRYVDVDQSQLAQWAAMDYEHGIIGSVTDGVANSNGFVRVGPFPTTNLVNVFGF